MSAGQMSMIPGVEAKITPQEVEEKARLALSAHYEKWFTGIQPFENVSVDQAGWFAIYQILVEEKGRPWRQAAYMAWKAWPGDKWPESQQEMAKILGLTSDRQFYTWRAKDPSIDEQIQLLWDQLVKDQVMEVDRASLIVAMERDYKATQERRLFYQRHGILDQETTVRIRLDDVSQLSDAELQKLIESQANTVEGEVEEVLNEDIPSFD